jgi:hypothetical protein
LIFNHTAPDGEEPQCQQCCECQGYFGSSPVDVVPPWNHCSESFLEACFLFAEEYLQDDGGVIVIHPFHVDAKSTILGYSAKCNFEIWKEWLCMN